MGDCFSACSLVRSTTVTNQVNLLKMPKVGQLERGFTAVPGCPTIWITVGQGPTALTVGAGGRCLDIFTLIYPFPPLTPSLWETARYRLKYYLKGPLSQKQPTNLLLKYLCDTADDFFYGM